MKKTNYHDYWYYLIEALAEGVLITNDEGMILYANEYAGHLFGHSSKNLIGTLFSYPLTPDVKQEIEILQKNGQVITVQFVVKKGAWKNLYAWIISLQNISDLKLNETQLKLTSTAFKAAFEGIVITDENFHVVQANSSFLKMTGYSLKQLIENSPLEFFKSGFQDIKHYHHLLKQLNETGHWIGEVWFKAKNDELLPMVLSISSVKNMDNDIINYIGFYYDLREEIKQHEKIEYIKTYDYLTGLSNTFSLIQKLEKYISEQSVLDENIFIIGVRVYDSDKKHIRNDVISDSINNLILAAVDRVNKVTLNKKIFARTGFREFVIVYSSFETLSDMKAHAELIIKELTRPFYINKTEFIVECNIGIVEYENNLNISAETFLQQVEATCHLSRQQGKNKIAIYDPDVEREVLVFNQHIDAIRSAITNNQFQLFYQPKVNIITGKILGFEALIRWQHPDKGLLTPDKFSLNQLDNHPISIDIGHWVQNAVLQQLNNLHQDHFNFPISVNISSFQLQQTDFVNDLISMFSRHPNLPTNLLMLEILETAALEDLSLVNNVIAKCRPFGIKISLDDFGTGYSSLTYIKELHVDEVKIDQSFVRDCINRTDDLIILKTIIHLFQTLGLDLIAEGVETEIHAKLLLTLGCSNMQGFAISKPLVGTKVVNWVKHWNPEPTLNQMRYFGSELVTLIQHHIHHYIGFNIIHRYVSDNQIPINDFRYESCNYAQWLNEHKYIFKNEETYSNFDKLHQELHEQALNIIQLVNTKNPAIVDLAINRLEKSRRYFIYQLVKSVYG